MTKTKRTIIGMALLAAMLFTVGCNRHRHDPEKRAEWITDRIADKLDLTEPQIVKLNAVKDEMLSVRKEFRTNRDKHFDSLLSQVTAEELDQAKLQTILEEHTAMIQQASPRVIAKIADFHASLTPAQKAEAAEKLQKLREWHDDK